MIVKTPERYCDCTGKHYVVDEGCGCSDNCCDLESKHRRIFAAAYLLQDMFEELEEDDVPPESWDELFGRDPLLNNVRYALHLWQFAASRDASPVSPTG